ncbi:gliding motility associated protein GldN [Mucilaginibacter gracilis]|uniref:Gliding motility associated protein GldN n=1 Tax=Mucilaginibacter gracilis TaxID=423350 RepID=A0A495J2P6_9SPHI|nr:gliding motility protein GldN [Mucilaginibacter gracilis]RKR82279.1 gliding motility associated protein GldN [Mucilaginibacter gracilis]
MKKKFIIVLFITLAASLTLMAQTKKKKAKARTTAKRTIHTVRTKPKPKPVDTTAKAAVNPVVVLPANNKIDTIRSVPDSGDGYLKSIVLTKARPFPIFEPSPNNIKYYHQYKRDISFKDARNAKFNTTGATLIEAILQGVKDHIITAYDPTAVTKINPTGDAFTIPMTYNQLMGHLVDTALVDQLDKDGNKIGSVKQLNDFSPDKVVGYRIKEDVYYDKQRAKVETHIVGIAPLITLKLSNGDTVGTQPVCWLRYSQCRIVFAKMDVSDPDHNMFDVSMDDMFLQRQFNSVIVEESNPKGNRIKDYMKTPEDQAKEAARIEKKLADYKKNMWNYRTDITAVSVPDKTKTTKPKKTTNDNNTGTPVKQ